MSSELFSEPVLFYALGWPVTPTMLTSTASSLLVLASLRYLARALMRAPDGRAAAAARLAVGALHTLVAQAAGVSTPALEVLAGTLFSFIAAAALIGQLPAISAPTANLAATGALATVVFLAVPVMGVRAQGLRAYLGHYFQPSPLLFPLHVISELSRTLALALRLFGNMMSGHMVVALIVMLVGVLLPVPLMALDLLIGALQAYIFTVLASVYIGAAMQVQEGEKS